MHSEGELQVGVRFSGVPSADIQSADIQSADIQSAEIWTTEFPTAGLRTAGGLEAELEEALSRARQNLLDRQQPGGAFLGAIEAGVLGAGLGALLAWMWNAYHRWFVALAMARETRRELQEI